uniref:SSD domain-containing protein n=1 Tax=Ascaris lumbricoides TaxID=6252 RepID=A0A0M3I9S2_ASCLU
MRIFFAEEIIGQARIIIKLNGFNANAFERLCSFDNELHRRGLLNHREHCKKADRRDEIATECCPSIHIAWLLAAAADNETHCSEVADETRQAMMATLEQCYRWSRKVATSEWSDINEDDSIAKVCSKQTYKYAVDYLLPINIEDGGLYSMFILPYPSNVMKHIMNANSVIDLIESHKNEVIGFDFAMKEGLFVRYLNTDVVYGFVALFLVSITLLSSTCSPLFTIAVLLTIGQFDYQLPFL